MAESLSPAVVYATKGNIDYPGTQDQATADEAAAQSRLDDALDPVTTTVPGGSIHVASYTTRDASSGSDLLGVRHPALR